MENCRIVPLKGECPAIKEKLGCLNVSLNFSALTDSFVCRFLASEVEIESNLPLTLKNGSTVLGTGVNISLALTGPTSINFYPEANGDYEISIYSKYSIVNLNFNNGCIIKSLFPEYLTAISILELNQPSNSDFTLDVNSLSNNPALTSLSSYCNNGVLYGDIANLPENNYKEVNIQGGSHASVSGNISKFNNKTNIQQITLSRTSVEGNIEGLNNLTKLTRLNISYSENITGDVCTLAEGLLSNGKTTGDVTFRLIGTSCTIKGDSITSAAQATFSASSIVINCGDYTYTYDGVEWTRS